MNYLCNNDNKWINHISKSTLSIGAPPRRSPSFKLAIYPAKIHSDAQVLYWAFVLSIGMHITLAAIYIKPIRTTHKPSFDLTVALVPIEKLESTALEIPPVAVQPPPKPAPKLIQTVPKNTAAPATINSPQQSEFASIVAPISPQKEVSDSPVVATEFSPNNTESVAIASPQKIDAPPQKSPSADTKNARAQYGALLAQEITKFKQYPALAKQTRQQGVVILQLQMNSLGALISAKVYQSSTYELLDNQALEMVKKATPFSQPPVDLREHDLSVLVPVSFRLN
jgi:protein TonB